jgi:hypothetical protein
MSSVSGSLTMASHSPAEWEGGETSQTQRREVMGYWIDKRAPCTCKGS